VTPRKLLSGGERQHTTEGDFDRAIADYNEAITLDPKNAGNALNNRGLAYAKKDDLNRAIADFNEAIKLDPLDPLAFHNRGIAYAHKKDFKRAIAQFNAAIRLKPNYSLALYFRGLAKQQSGDKTGAADIARARQLDPSVGK
jgi:tetratricopeptide (TPR) repeat protein